MNKFRTAKVTVGLPKLAAVILGALAIVAQVVNYSLVPASSRLHAEIAIGIYFILAAGVPPLTGSQFQAFLHLPAWANYLISAAIGAALLALTTIQMAVAVHEILAAALSALSALGFSASVQPISPMPAHAAAAVKRSGGA